MLGINWTFSDKKLRLSYWSMQFPNLLPAPCASAKYSCLTSFSWRLLHFPNWIIWLAPLPFMLHMSWVVGLLYCTISHILYLLALNLPTELPHIKLLWKFHGLNEVLAHGSIPFLVCALWPLYIAVRSDVNPLKPVSDKTFTSTVSLPITEGWLIS